MGIGLTGGITLANNEKRKIPNLIDMGFVG
jgi:hypothetical protein